MKLKLSNIQLVFISVLKYIEIFILKCYNISSNIEHEATVSKISEDNLFYLNNSLNTFSNFTSNNSFIESLTFGGTSLIS